MQGPFSVETMLVGTGFSEGKNKGRLLEAVPPPHAYRFTNSNFGDWVEVALTTEQAERAMKIGSPVVVLELGTMEVSDIVHADTCREKIEKLPPTSGGD